MFRLQKAIEKAKAKRADMYDSVSASHISPLERINYSQTVSVKVSSETLEKNRIIAGAHNDPRSHLFRTLRTKLIQKMRTEGLNTLAITSPTGNAGSSLLACNLAVAMSMEVNQTVLLVDLNLRNPSISEYFGLGENKSILDFLYGQAELNEILINPGLDRLVIVPGGQSEGNSSELVSSPRMKSFIKDTKKKYKSRIVIYDLPAILPTDDALIALEEIDAALLVVADGQNKSSELKQALDLMEGTNLLGTVRNKA